jgi:methyltransferase (TIGR00027 family)
MHDHIIEKREYTLEELERTWESDKKERADPPLLTEIFHHQVPILKYLDWKVTATERGFAETVLPINVASTNQHITHQAAVIMIAADYTGGIALATLLNKVPVIGINAQQTDYGAYLWAGKAEVKWIRPSCADLICTARIPAERHLPIVKRFFRGSMVLETVKIEMRNEDLLVAEAQISYWGQDTFALRRNAGDENRIHPLYDHKQKTSARLIAGLRSIEQDKPAEQRLFNDPLAAKVAAKHGRILAERFCLVAPQLQPMVASRTRHLDQTLENFHQGRPIQIVNLGIGLDTRTLRVSLPEGSVSFELDLPVMLSLRDELLRDLPVESPIKRVAVPIDLREQDPAEVLSACGEFDISAPVFFIWEGGSMYFEPVEAARILRSLQSMMVNPDSRLWMDYVLPSIIDGTSGFRVVEDFMREMRSLSEPFINGFADLKNQLAELGFMVEEDLASNYCLETTDAVFDLYRFCLTRRK